MDIEFDWMWGQGEGPFGFAQDGRYDAVIPLK